MTDFVDDLLGRMSLDEKVGQLNHPNAYGADTTGAGGAVSGVEARIRRGEVGSLAGGAGRDTLREWQRLAVEESPSGVPLMFTMDVIHGHRTIFPLPIALACAFEPELVRRTTRQAAREATAEGLTLNWAPMLDVSRDARWGRCAEGPGEDPLVGADFARAAVAGYQDDDLAQPDAMLACAKHFAGYGQSEAGRDYNAADISPYRLHNTVLPPFQAALAAGVGAVMVGFHDLAGIPCTAHVELLRGLLRGRWGFDGLLVSDYTAILELVHHGVAADLKDAARLALRAGVDIDLVSEAYVRHLPALVAEGAVPLTEVDAACRRVLLAKRRLGLFEDPYRGLHALAPATPDAASRRLAREVGQKSCVLLKNDGTLPLARDGRTVALVGPLADSAANMQGTWAVAANDKDSVTVLAGLTAAGGIRLVHAKGANIVDDPAIAARLNVFGPTAPIDPKPPAELIAEAVAVAGEADVIVACVGEAKEHSGEAASRTDLGLPGSQQQLLEALHATGRPLVVVTMSGRPLALEWAARHAAAILHAWFAGTEAGNAIADLLLGEASPSGKLSMSFPRDAGQCPVHYAEAPTGRPVDRIGVDAAGDTEVDRHGRRVFRKFTTACRIEGPMTPLYAFGHGLTYGDVEYGALRLDKTELQGDDTLTASIELRNAGRHAVDEIVQLYVSDPVASRSRPVRELKHYRKVALAPSATAEVRFAVTVADLRFCRADRIAEPETLWEPGRFVIGVGRSSDDLAEAAVEWRAGDA